MEGFECFRRLGYLPDELRWRAEQEEGAGKADGQEGAQLDDRFQRHGKNEAILVFGRIRMARAEKDCEGGEHGCDRQGNIAEDEDGWIDGCSVIIHHEADTARNCFQLQRDIGNGADGGNAGGKRGDAEALAIARRQKIGDGGDVLGFGQPHDMAQQPVAKRKDENGADIDAKKLKPALRGKPDRAEKGPGGAIDGEAQRIDIGRGVLLQRAVRRSPMLATAKRSSRYKKAKPMIPQPCIAGISSPRLASHQETGTLRHRSDSEVRIILRVHRRRISGSQDNSNSSNRPPFADLVSCPVSGARACDGVWAPKTVRGGGNITENSAFRRSLSFL